MKKILSFILLLSISVVLCGAEFKKDIALTDGVWIDSRAYSTFAAAITASSAGKILAINKAEAVTANKTILSDVVCFNSGSITTSTGYTTTFSGKFIGRNACLLGDGDYDFVAGSEVRASWFSSLTNALNKCSDDNVTLIIDTAGTIASNIALGSNLKLKWESSGYLITVSSTYTLSNIGSIEADSFQLFAGAGDFDFVSGTNLKSSWFSTLYIASGYLADDTVNLVSDKSETLDHAVTLPATVYYSISNGKVITTNSNTFTIGSYFEHGHNQCFSGTGVALSNVGDVYPRWWGTTPDIVLPITAIGSTVAALIVDENTSISANTTIPSTTYVEFRGAGKITAATSKTLAINGTFYAPQKQVFSGFSTSAITFGYPTGVYAIWWYSGTGSWTNAVTSAGNALSPLAAATLSPLYIPFTVSYGNDPTTSSVDALINSNRAVDDTGSGNAHCFSDSSTITRGASPGPIGYNSFDARCTFDGTADYDHYAGFQYSPTYSSSGTMTNAYGFYLADPIVDGGGTITNNYGIYIQTMDSGTNNYAIKTGDNTVWFGGEAWIADCILIGTTTGVSQRGLIVDHGTVRIGEGYQLEFGGIKAGITGSDTSDTVTLFTTSEAKVIVNAGGDLEIVKQSKGIIMTNAAGTVTKRVRLNDAGNGLIYENE